MVQGRSRLLERGTWSLLKDAIFLAGARPVRVSAGAPGSRPQWRKEIPRGSDMRGLAPSETMADLN